MERSEEESTELVCPLTKNHDLWCLFLHRLLVIDLNVFICLHKGAPCISVEVKETNNLTESHMHAQRFCLWFYFLQPVIREFTWVHSEAK